MGPGTDYILGLIGHEALNLPLTSCANLHSFPVSEGSQGAQQQHEHSLLSHSETFYYLCQIGYVFQIK